MKEQNMYSIICPQNLVNNVSYPLGYVLGASVSVVEFDQKFQIAFLKSGLPITLGCSKNEFFDCLERTLELDHNFSHVSVIDLYNQDKERVKNIIMGNECKVCGYINCDSQILDSIFKDLEFHDIPGAHIFHLPEAITFHSFCNHIYLQPLKYRFIDAILTLHFWGKARGEEVDYAVCTQAALRGGYRDAKVLVDKYMEIAGKIEIEGAIIKNESYKELTHKEFMERAERDFLISKLDENGGNIAKTAKQVGISRNTLKKKAELYES